MLSKHVIKGVLSFHTHVNQILKLIFVISQIRYFLVSIQLAIGWYYIMFLMLYEYSPHSHTLGIIVKQLHRCIIAKSMHAGNFCVKVPALDTDFNFIHKIRIILLGPLLASFMFTELLYITAHYLFPFCNLSLLATTPSLFHP